MPYKLDISDIALGTANYQDIRNISRIQTNGKRLQNTQLVFAILGPILELKLN
jgi:hypothetical protein